MVFILSAHYVAGSIMRIRQTACRRFYPAVYLANPFLWRCYMKKVLVPLLSLLLALIFLPCQAAESEFEELKAQQVKELLDSGQEIVLLNGVSDIMYNQGFIPGSLNVVLEEIPTSELMPKNLDTLIVSYCMGRR